MKKKVKIKPNYPKEFDNKFAKELLAYFGYTDFYDWDEKWCWEELCLKYIQYKDKLLKYIFSFESTHNICDPLFWLCKYKVIDNSLVEPVIEKNNNALYAYRMVRECNSDRKWAENIIEKCNDMHFAYIMVRDCNSDKYWAEKIIKKMNNCFYAYLMTKYCGSSQEWYESIEKGKN